MDNTETSGIRTGNYRIGINQPVFDQEGESKISVEDLAVALLDEVEKNQFIKKFYCSILNLRILILDKIIILKYINALRSIIKKEKSKLGQDEPLTSKPFFHAFA